jgi:DNA-binding response OmpR family regulator
MESSQLANKRVLVVEDDYLVAMDIARALERAGAEVIGPAPGVEAALDVLERTVPDGAILDINLGGEMAFPVADALMARGIPFIFATGYDAQVIPVRFIHVKRCEKPMASEQICAALFGSGVTPAGDQI